MTEYRRLIDSDTWHWCTNCTDWPTGTEGVDYIAIHRKDRPVSGELDNQCKRKEAKGICDT